jgi:hypothetical protein
MVHMLPPLLGGEIEDIGSHRQAGCARSAGGNNSRNLRCAAATPMTARGYCRGQLLANKKIEGRMPIRRRASCC